MKSDETETMNVNMNDETVVMDDNIENSTESVPQNVGNRSKTNWKQVTIGGTTGLLMGAAGVFLMSGTTGGNTGDETDTENGETGYSGGANEQPVLEGNLPVATVSDDLSFGEAFAQARHDVGAGGLFEWHGNVYNTYQAEEWNSMTDEQKADFGGRVSGSLNVAHNSADADVAVDDVAVDDVVVDDVEVHNETAVLEHGNDATPIPESELDVQVLGVETVALEGGAEATVGVVLVSGEDVYVVDVDNDGTFDVMMSDVNNDGEFTADEVVDVSNEQMLVSDFEQQVPENYFAETTDDGMSDYMNDADPGIMI